MEDLVKVLIVDDEEDVRIFLEDFLLERNLQVDTACNGVEALKRMEKTPYHIVLLDIMMPEMDGLECLKVLHQKYPKTVVIMITALKDDEKVAKAKKLGARDYIIKPFSLNYLETELTRLIEQAGTSKKS